MSTTSFPQTFEEVRLDLEIDLQDNGGVQRFRTVGDFQIWLNEEIDAWKWLREGQATQAAANLSYIRDHFWSCLNQAQQWLSDLRPQWQQAQQRYQQFSQEQDEKRRVEQTQATMDAFQRQVQRAKPNLISRLASGFIQPRHHLFRGHPDAEFVFVLKETHPWAATYALHYFLLKQIGVSNEPGIEEPVGRMLAYLFQRGWLPKKDGQRLAYDNTVKTWAQELAHFKQDYEAQQMVFAESAAAIQAQLTEWKAKAETLQNQFEEQKKSNQANLDALTQTYEVHMQLHGPKKYWEQKRKEHDAMAKKFRLWTLIAAVISLPLLLGTAWVLLPANHPAGTIPWREIGFFLLVSTFLLWAIRLLVKLLLSHIHLHADAREREVMISTFMALVRRPETQTSLTKEDIALVLAPLFRPSTTGVINDEGGPVTLTDFISRIAGRS